MIFRCTLVSTHFEINYHSHWKALLVSIKFVLYCSDCEATREARMLSMHLQLRNAGKLARN